MNDIGQTLLADLNAAKQKAIDGFSKALAEISAHITALEQDMAGAHAAAETAFEVRLAMFRGEFPSVTATPAFQHPAAPLAKGDAAAAVVVAKVAGGDA